MGTNRRYRLHRAACAFFVLALVGCSPERAPVASQDAGTCTGSSCDDGLGHACVRNGDCASGLCVPTTGGNICSAACSDTTPCLAGWVCNANACRCTASAEICDGLDNDCNGVVDDQPGTNEWCVAKLGERHSCALGACAGAVCTSTSDCLADEGCDPNSNM